MTARIVNAIARTIPTVNSNLAGFGFGAMGPLLALQIDVAMLDFRGAKRKRCVSYFTLRGDMIPHTHNCCSMAIRPEGDGRRAEGLVQRAAPRCRHAADERDDLNAGSC